MKVVFVGPTLAGEALPDDESIAFRGPARQGDLHRAVMEGATVAGLIDGVFENVPSIWHKEILFALSSGVTVLGAASMGALRAAECDRFGMIGVGEVYRQYAEREIEDDADVAQLHAPVGMGYRSLTQPMVNVRAALARLRTDGLVDEHEYRDLYAAAATLNFRERTYSAVVSAAIPTPSRRDAVAELLAARAVNLKRQDGLELVERVRGLPDRRVAPPLDWSFQETSMWCQAFGAADAGR
jgi:hypothetical protein